MGMTATTALALVLSPLPAPLVVPPSAERVVADGPGYPCRRCLRDATAGEELHLLSYDPWLGESPYRQPGPIFVHVSACHHDPAAGGDELPVQLTSRVLSVRAFDAQHRMTSCELTPGDELAESAARLFADDSAAYLHVHNAGAGCFAVRIDRA